MAGIGFELRKLIGRETLWSMVESHLHGIVVVAGPWFFTIVAMALPALVFGADDPTGSTRQFVTLLLYAFSLSLTLTSPIAIGLTRHVSDRLFAGDVQAICRSFVGALLLALACAVPVLVWAAVTLPLPRETLLAGGIAYPLVTMTWITSPMLSTLREFRLLTGAYAAGTVLFALTLLTGQHADANALLLGFDAGMALTNALVIGLVLRSFPGPAEPMLELVGSMMRYGDLVAGGLLYGAGIWIDKWLMWGAPEHVITSGLASYPTYDNGAFLAYVTTVPALSLFIVRAETTLHDACQTLYGDISRHASAGRLELDRRALVSAFLTAGRDVVLLQVSITALVLLLPTLLLDALEVPHGGVFMFRFCALGAAFQSGALMLTIVLHYFDSRRAVLGLYALFLCANGLATQITLQIGLPTYGMGYFFAALVTFCAAYVVVVRSLDDLLFLAFVRQNSALTAAGPAQTPATLRFEARTGPSPIELVEASGEGQAPAQAGAR